MKKTMLITFAVLTAVPDAFFKIAYGGTSTVTRAWIFPNRKGNRKLSDYSVPVDVVERFTGLKFNNR